MVTPTKIITKALATKPILVSPSTRTLNNYEWNAFYNDPTINDPIDNNVVGRLGRTVSLSIRSIFYDQYKRPSKMEMEAAAREARAKARREAHWKAKVKDAATLYESNKWQEGAASFEDLLQEADPNRDSTHPDTLMLKQELALGKVKLGQVEQAQQLYREVLLGQLEIHDFSDPEIRPTVRSLASAYVHQGENEKAREIYSRVFEETRKRDQWGLATMETAMDMVKALLNSKSPPELTEAERLCIQVWDNIPRVNPGQLARKGLSVWKVSDTLGHIYHLQGKHAHARSLFESSLGLVDEEVGPDHADAIEVVEHLSALLYDMGEYSTAEDLFLRSWITRSIQNGPWHTSTLTALEKLGKLLFQMNRDNEAEQVFLEVLQGRKRKLGTSHRDVELTASNLEQLYVIRAKESPHGAFAAKVRIDLLNSIPDELKDFEHENVRTIIDDIDLLGGNLKMTEQLEVILYRILAERSESLGKTHAETMRTSLLASSLCHKQKNLVQAESLARRALSGFQEAKEKDALSTALSTCNLAYILNRTAVPEKVKEAQVLSQQMLFELEDVIDPGDYETALTNRLTTYGLTHWTFSKENRAPFTILDNLGSGAYGVVNEVRMAGTGPTSRTYAQKIFRVPNDRLREDRLQMIENEVYAMRMMSGHPHVVRVVCTYEELGKHAIILSPLADEDLESYLYRQLRNKDIAQQAQSSDLSNLPCWYGCLASSLEFIHSRGIRHKDIKPRNILVKGSMVYFTDFGSSRSFSSELTSATEGDVYGGNTKMYSAPEVMLEERRGRPADVFSLGCVFTEMLTVLIGKPLADFHRFRTTKDEYGETHAYYKTGDKVDEWFKDVKVYNTFIKPMLAMDAAERPTAKEIAEKVLRHYGTSVIGCKICYS